MLRQRAVRLFVLIAALAAATLVVASPEAPGALGPLEAGIVVLEATALAPTDIAVAADRRAIEMVEQLEALGLPTEGMDLLTDIEAAAAGGEVDLQTIDRATWLVPDPELAEKVRMVLTAYAEAMIFGDSVSVGVQLLPPALAPGLEAPVTPDVGGTCTSCPMHDFPTPVTAFVPVAAPTVHGPVFIASGDCAIYEFTVVPGREYEFSTCANGGTGPLNSLLEISGPTVPCTVIASADDTIGCGSQTTLKFCPPVGMTTLHLKVRGSGGASGSYNLSFRESALVCPCADTCVSPGTMIPVPTAACQYASGSLTNTCRSRFYEVFLTQGVCYVFTLCPSTCPLVTTAVAGAGAGFDPLFRLWDPSCVQRATSGDFCGANPQITFTPSLTGFHRLEVSSSLPPGVAQTFSYTFGYRQCLRTCHSCLVPRFGPLTPSTACQIAPGTSIDVCGEDNFYAVNLAAGCTYIFTVCETAHPSFPGCTGTADFDTILELFNPPPLCTLFASDNDGCPANLHSRLVVGPIAVAGQYSLKIRGVNRAIGTYTLAYSSTCNVAPPCTPPSGLSLAPTTGIADANCRRNETFTVNVASGTPPINYNWLITPPAGGSATPASGTVSSGPTTAGPAQFTSMLQGGCGGGTFSIAVTASNTCVGGGSTSNTFSYTLVDATPPTVDAPPSTTVSCSDPIPAATATAADNCDPNPMLNLVSATVTVGCPDRRVITRTWTATDCAGNTATDTQVITITDNQAPIFSGVPADGSPECDAVPAAPAVTATDNCDPSPTVTFVEVITPGDCPGRSTIVRTWTATDRCLNSRVATQTLNVVDTQPPTFAGSPDTELACLWAPNHDYVCLPSAGILSQLSASDACSGPVTYAIVGVASDQPDDATGDGHTTMDVAPIGPDGLLCIRSERQGGDRDGRRYYILAVATDACGNASAPVEVGYIRVNHDSRVNGHNRNCIRSTPPRHSRGRGPHPLNP
jgi:hypothetical protein